MRFYSLALFAVVAAGVSSQPFSCFPRMRNTPSIKPFEQRMPDMPPNLVPFSGAPKLPVSKEQAAIVPNPVKPTSAAINLGRIYYGYYCIQCHGPEARGDGTVGRSYVPEPPDLTTPKVRSMSDGALAWAMVMGLGHEPVMDATAPLERRWYIVAFVRAAAPPK